MSNKSIKSFEQAVEYLGRKHDRPLANNTRIEYVHIDQIAIKYHGNTVVTFHPDFTVYSSCGWMTLTTKERINWSLPDGFYLWQEKSVWYISNRTEHKRYIFADGITVHSDGTVTGYAPETLQDEGNTTIKQIKRYVNGYIKALLDGDVPAPGAGDCFYCHMVTESGENLGDATKNSEHILGHLEESYYVPSLLVNAYKFNFRMSEMTKDGIARLWQKEQISEWQKSILERDIKASLTNYLKHELSIANR